MAEKQKYICENCKKSFQNPQALKMHERWKTCQNQTSSKQSVEEENPEEVASPSMDSEIVTPSSTEKKTAEDPEELSLNDIFTEENIEKLNDGDLVCSECGYSKLTGDEKSCPQCNEVFE